MNATAATPSIDNRSLERYAPNALSHSRLQVFKRCQRRFYIEYERGMERIGDTSDALRMGACFARALELADPKAPWIEVYADRLNAAQDQRAVDAVIIESAIVEYYAAKYLELYGKADYREIEYEFGIPGTDFTFRGAVDGLEQIAPPDHFEGIEDKFKSHWLDSDIASLPLNQQVTAEIFGLREAGYNIHTVKFRVVKKPTLKRKKGRGNNPVPESVGDYVQRCIEAVEAAPHEFFLEYRETRTQDDLDEFALFISDYARQIEKSRESGVFPRSEETCSYMEGCAHREVCCRIPSAGELYQVKPGYPGSEV